MKKIFILFLLLGLHSICFAKYEGDGLGNHKARKSLDMNNFDINNITNAEVLDDITIASRPCAYFSYYLNGSSLTTINTGDTYELICGTGIILSISAWFNAVTDANGNDNRITYVGTNTHKFFISIDGCIRTNSATPSVPSIQVRENGTAIPFAENSPYLSVQNKDTSFSIGCIVELATNDYLELWATTDDGDDLLADHIQVVAVAID